ncbi:MAG: helix-turn-helix domain-containing protein [Provencibacterium sp.]|nr:helix-turn-helix domain-containing protein [Provencibacterium sp.]
MPKYLELSAEDPARLCAVGKALSSPVRLAILRLLQDRPLNIREIAAALSLPPSSAGLHVRALEEARLLETAERPGGHGLMKVCSPGCDYLSIRLNALPAEKGGTRTIHMAVGSYTDCDVSPTCGLAGETGPIGLPDDRANFFSPERIGAQLIWSSGGYLEYKFPNPVPEGCRAGRLTLSAEVCAEAPGYREDWPSEITLWLNGVDCGPFLCPGDFGSRRGRLNPDWWPDSMTQYGLLASWSISEQGCTVGGLPLRDPSIGQLHIEDNFYITARLGIREGARCAGGFNLFGERFGDFPQDIVLQVQYEP